MTNVQVPVTHVSGRTIAVGVALDGQVLALADRSLVIWCLDIGHF
jgi:hypothetical protein